LSFSLFVKYLIFRRFFLIPHLVLILLNFLYFYCEDYSWYGGAISFVRQIQKIHSLLLAEGGNLRNNSGLIKKHKRLRRIKVLAQPNYTVAFFMFAMVGCATVSPKPPSVATLAVAPSSSEGRQETNSYQLCQGDVLDIKFPLTPELNESVAIRPDGKISLQLVGEMMVVGLTPSDLTKKLQEQYARTLITPEVSVIVRSFAGQKAFVGGEVNSPGVISFDSQPTLLQALIQVGWLKGSAQLRNVVIIRKTGASRPDVLFVDVQKWIEEPDQTPPVLLQPFDVVYVPKTKVAKVNDFIKQYIDDPILTPISRIVGFSFFYELRGLNVDAGQKSSSQ
jgi:protein involved in polysaccharide export with SLBB domain